MSTVRALNMEKRRERILAQAREMLARGGFDSLNLRDLAEVSGVTVPTIYNLIGNKAEILKSLVLDSFAQYDQVLQAKLPCPTTEMPALMISTLFEIMSKEEAGYRATGLAMERLESDPASEDVYAYKRAPLREYLGNFCQAAVGDGLLRGDIDRAVLIEVMINHHQVAFRDWVHRAISLEDLMAQTLQGFYVALAADATDEYREIIFRELRSS